MDNIKTLANCTLAEFLRQANKIRKTAADFYKSSGIAEIRKHLPDVTGKTKEEAEAMLKEQNAKNISDILDVCLDTNAEKTIEIIGLFCFKEGNEVNDLTPTDFLGVVIDLISSERVMSFFIKLANMDQKSTEDTSQE